MEDAERAVEDAEGLDAFTDLLDYAMYIVTTAADGERSGCLVGFLTQCSIDPPRFLVCLSHRNHTMSIAQRARFLAVHVLERDQRPLAELFGATTGDEIDKFERCAWEPGADGVPLLTDCPARLVGRVVATHDLGDHLGFLLDVVEASATGTPSLLTFHDVRNLDPGHDA